MKSVADYIATKFSLEAVPGKKGTCPFCGKGTFSINSEDTIGKCFHPDCGRHVSSTTMRNEVEDIIQTALKSVMAQCRAALFDGTPLSAQALEYLQGERKIHELVIRESYIGVVPANIDISTPFGAAIQALQISLHGVSNNTRRAKIEEGLEKLGGMQAKLAATTGKALNYICFFYTDDQLNITQIRFRKPFTKQFMSWAGDKRKGVFGLPLMVASEDVGPLIVVEGEFNLLRMQSVAIGKGSDELTNKVFSNVVALGSASGPDFDTLMALSSFPVFVHDNDAAGKSVVNAALDRMYLKACTTPLPAKDLDEYVDAFGDIDAAWFGIQQLLDSAAAYYRNLTSIMAEIRGVRNSGYREFKTNQFVSEIVLRDLIIRAKLLKNSGRGYLFNLESKRLIRLEKDAAEFASLMSQYGLNPIEKVYGYVLGALTTLVYDTGEECEPRKFAHYSPTKNILYVSCGKGAIYKITTDSIALVDNGTDGCLFLDNGGDSLPLISEPAREGYIKDILVSRINFEEGELTAEELGELFMVWLKAIFFNSILPTKPVMAFIGEKGSGKSFTLRRAGILLFGQTFDVTPLPKDEKDFDVMTSSSHLLAIDNADSRSDWLEDRIAVISTGGVIRARKLYTDNQVVELRPQCYLAITARTPKFRRDDVADRLLIMPLKRLDVFSPEATLLEEVLILRKELISELLTSLQKILKTLADPAAPKYSGGLRMADFADFALKVAYGEDRLEIMKVILAKLSGSQSHFTLQQDGIAELLETWVNKPGNSSRYLTNKELFLELKLVAQEIGDSFTFKSHRAFAQRMSNIRPNLKEVFEIEERTSGARVMKYCFTIKSDAASSKFREVEELF